jgi:Fructose/tagatose bisphosphate aldolase
MLLTAWRSSRCIAGINIYTLDQAIGVLDACEQAAADVILQVSLRALDDLVGPTMAGMCDLAHRSTVLVGLHLDHASEAEIDGLLDLGFDAVMFDGSAMPWLDNISATRRVVQVARARGISVEGELGQLAGVVDDGEFGIVGSPTDPESAGRFVEMTQVDALAVAVGNIHGPTSHEPTLDLGRLDAIRRLCPVPLVLHGASGLSGPILQAAVSRGVAKVNVNTEIRSAYVNGLSVGAS